MLGGLLTLHDLRGSEALTPQQRLGLKHFDDLQINIPREEMDVWNVHPSVLQLTIGDNSSGYRNGGRRLSNHTRRKLVIPVLKSF